MLLGEAALLVGDDAAGTTGLVAAALPGAVEVVLAVAGTEDGSEPLTGAVELESPAFSAGFSVEFSPV